jgi:hypothetical protein
MNANRSDFQKQRFSAAFNIKVFPQKSSAFPEKAAQKRADASISTVVNRTRHHVTSDVPSS